MKPRDLFNVLFWVIGLGLVVLAMQSVSVALCYWMMVDLSADVVGEYLRKAVTEFLVGLYLLSGAKHLVNRCFPEEDDQK